MGIALAALLLALPGRAKVGFARVYHAVLCRLIGLKVRVVGAPCRDRPVLFLANHSSWLDILVLGGVLFYAVFLMIVNLLVDLVQARLDPRVELA